MIKDDWGDSVMMSAAVTRRLPMEEPSKVPGSARKAQTDFRK